MSAPAIGPAVTAPFSIFRLAHRYMLYDPDTVAYVRREHNICGVLVGGLPQAPQQNVFLGLPLELMPEEARSLVEKGVAYIVDDVASHKRAFLYNGLDATERRAYQAAIRRQGLSAAKEKSKRTNERTKAALKQKRGTEDWNDIPDDVLKTASGRREKEAEVTVSNVMDSTAQGEVDSTAQGQREMDSTAQGDDDSLFASSVVEKPAEPRTSQDSSVASIPGIEPFAVTPTTSYPPLQSLPSASKRLRSLPVTPQSYPLFSFLHDKGYFLTPGLRFGCQYVAYPGDPLRFHSHFLCNGMEWEQEFDLLDVIGGGRLGTGVKKGFLIGGAEEGDETSELHGNDKDSGVRAFCIEWGGM